MFYALAKAMESTDHTKKRRLKVLPGLLPPPPAACRRLA
jgi:hypothetical protein